MPKQIKRTSKQAYQSVKPHIKTQHDKILRVLKGRKRGINFQLIAEKAGMESVQVARRLSELARQNLICEDGTLSLTKSGRSAMNWRLNEAA